MHQTLRAFELVEPATITQAVDFLESYAGHASVLAGGIDLIAKMRRWQLAPQCLVSLRRIPGLEQLIVNPTGELEIGPMARLWSLESLAAVQKGWPVVYESVHQIASVQVKTMGTVVGNLCVATTASDVAVALYVLDARFTLAGPQGERSLPIENFFVPVASSVLARSEIVTQVTVPPLASGSGTAFQKLAHTKACIAKVNAAARVRLQAGLCVDVRIAMGAVGPTFIRARRAEALLEGRPLGAELIAAAAAAAAADSEPQSDLRASAGYRRRTVEVLVGRALAEAVCRAGEGR